MNRRRQLSAVSGIVVAALASSSAWAATAPNMGQAGSFAALAGSQVDNTGPTVLNGDLGVFPGSVITGFPPGILVGGATHTTDVVAQQAETDTTAAYLDLAGQPATIDMSGTDLGGLTLTTGVYKFTSSAILTGTLTLDAQGVAGAVFIFQVGSLLDATNGSRVQVINGGTGCNVFWQVGSSATIGTTSTFVGSVLALTSVTMQTGATLAGRALARNGQVTLDSNTITSCSSAGGSTGDPHMRTLDGLGYEFQECGDFVLLRTAAMEVQVRQSPWPGGTSVNSAVGMRLGSHEVRINPLGENCTTAGGTLSVGCIEVDRQPVTFECDSADRAPGCLKTAVLSGEGRLEERVIGYSGSRATRGLQSSCDRGGAGCRAQETGCPASITLTLLTGETVRACLANHYVNVTVTVPAGLRGATSGLLGNSDGDPTNDLQVPSGHLPLSTTFESFYGTFGEHWRVSESHSLFEPIPGGMQHCVTGPSLVSDLAPEARGRALGVCQSLGVNEGTMNECVMDAALLGDDAALAFVGMPAPRAVVTLIGDKASPAFGGINTSQGGVLSPMPDPALPTADPVLNAVGCGCATSSGGSSIFAFALAGLAVMFSRRRRAS